MKYVAMPLSWLEILSTVAIEPVTKLSLAVVALVVALVTLGVGNSENRFASFFFYFLATVGGS